MCIIRVKGRSEVGPRGWCREVIRFRRVRWCVEGDCRRVRGFIMMFRRSDVVVVMSICMNRDIIHIRSCVELRSCIHMRRHVVHRLLDNEASKNVQLHLPETKERYCSLAWLRLLRGKVTRKVSKDVSLVKGRKLDEGLERIAQSDAFLSEWNG